MTPRYGIDTSVLVQLATGDPEAAFEGCVRALRRRISVHDAEIFASNMVIGESFVALRHHYGVDRDAARTALLSVLRSGLVAPAGGLATIRALEATSGAGLLDRLIATDYAREGMVTLTLDQRMAALPDAEMV